MATSESDYIRRMALFLNILPSLIREGPRPGLRYYGTGETAHWAVQSNLNIAAALAVMGTTKEEHARQFGFHREELMETALALFRYALATHCTGDTPATDGGRWGKTWISVLGLERAGHALELLRNHLTDKEEHALRELHRVEADWLLDEYEVAADPDGRSGRNRPESNLWNGSFLFRVATLFPELPRATAYRERATSFLLNSISLEADAKNETMFHGKPLREWHVGGQFLPTFSLDHHGYMNVGYSVIVLSNLAMLHFQYKKATPPEAFLHAAELWKAVRNFCFADGRLLRIGGDTRARRCYCQCYALPMYLLAQDAFGDGEAAALEAGYLRLLEEEQAENSDGSFYGKRLAPLREQSYYYYCRLESDPFLILSLGAWVRRNTDAPMEATPPAFTPFWSDDFHTADLIRDKHAIRSCVRAGAQGPVALALPAGRSDLAEWQGNFFSALKLHREMPRVADAWHCAFPGGFVNAGTTEWSEILPYGEGEGKYAVAQSRSAVAALPDGRTLLVLEQVKVLKEATFDEIETIHFLIPDDVRSKHPRRVRTETFERELPPPAEDECIDLGNAITVDDALTLRLLYGADGLKLRRPARQNIHNNNPEGRTLHSLRADVVCGDFYKNTRRKAGEILADTGTAAIIGNAAYRFRRIESGENLRIVEISGAEETFVFGANFGDCAAKISELSGINLATGERENDPALAPGRAMLWVRAKAPTEA